MMHMAAGGASVPREFFTARSYSSCLEKIFASGGGGVSDAGVARTSPDPECTPRTQRGTSVTAPHQGSDRPSLRITGAGRGETGERPPYAPPTVEEFRTGAARGCGIGESGHISSTTVAAGKHLPQSENFPTAARLR